MATALTPPPPRTRREQQRLATREQLFELAIDEFRRVGTAKARIRDIVEAAGVVPGTFYFHFPSKEHVVFELWRRSSQQLVAQLPAIDRDPPPRAEHYLRSLGEAMIDIEQRIGDSALVRDAIASVLRPPEGADPSTFAVGDAIVALLTGALERGEIASELGPTELASVLLTSILGVLMAAPADSTARRREVRRIIDFFLKALQPT